MRQMEYELARPEWERNDQAVREAAEAHQRRVKEEEEEEERIREAPADVSIFVTGDMIPVTANTGKKVLAFWTKGVYTFKEVWWYICDTHLPDGKFDLYFDDEAGAFVHMRDKVGDHTITYTLRGSDGVQKKVVELKAVKIE